MKRSISVLVPSAIGLAMLIGCSHSEAPPAELRDARMAYNRAATGPAAQYNPSGVIETRQALDMAEREFSDSPKSDEVKTLGYVASRKAEIAETNARMASEAKGAFIEQRKTLQKEEKTAERAERRAKVALDQLGLEAKEEPIGTVITLSGEGMFATNSAAILPDAKGRLTQIADAVKTVAEEKDPQDVGRKLMLVGYTDDTGSEQLNNKLSKERAEAVKDFFSKHGLNDAKMEVQGRGESDPIADNATPEGRAQNRRVEVVITNPSSGGGTK